MWLLRLEERGALHRRHLDGQWLPNWAGKIADNLKTHRCIQTYWHPEVFTQGVADKHAAGAEYQRAIAVSEMPCKARRIRFQILDAEALRVRTREPHNAAGVVRSLR